MNYEQDELMLPIYQLLREKSVFFWVVRPTASTQTATGLLLVRCTCTLGENGTFFCPSVRSHSFYHSLHLVEGVYHTSWKVERIDYNAKVSEQHRLLLPKAQERENTQTNMVSDNVYLFVLARGSPFFRAADERRQCYLTQSGAHAITSPASLLGRPMLQENFERTRKHIHWSTFLRHQHTTVGTNEPIPPCRLLGV